MLAWREAIRLLRERTYASPVTVLIVTVNLLIHFCLSMGGQELIDAAWRWGAISSARVLDHGEWWRLLTNAWLHGDYEHVISNCVAIFVLGLALEPVMTTLKFSVLYLVGTTGASIVMLTAGPGLSAGASDGAYALIGAMLVVPVCTRLRPAILLWTFIAINVALDMSTDFTSEEYSDLAYQAHIAGLLLGTVVGIFSGRGATRRQWEEDTVSPEPEPPIGPGPFRAGPHRPSEWPGSTR